MSHNKEEIFNKEESKITDILKKGINNIIKDKPALFDLKELTLKCMDERTPGGIHLAGAGILLGLYNAIEFIKKAKINKVTWHKECGAVALALKKRGERPTPDEIDERAKEFSESLAKEAGVEVEEEIMAGETTFHATRAIYFDNTGEFNVTEELSPGFVISRKYLDKEYAQEELKIAIAIAFGDHGFGELFSVEQPLLVVAVSEADQIDETDLEIEAVLMDIEEYKEERIKLDQIIK
jgi:hypothetical protein